MFEALAVAGLAIAVANVLFVVVLVVRRIRAARAERQAAERERRVTPLAHRLLDTGTIEEDLSPADQVAVAAVLARLSRLVKGDARANIGRYFALSRAFENELAALGSRRAWRRATAAFALGDMATEKAVPELLTALGDADRDVRAAAARSLGRLAAPQATDAIVRHLAEGTLPRLVASSVLLSLGETALPRLRELAAHPRADVRATAVELVGLVGTAREWDVLEPALADPEQSVRAHAAAAVGRVGARAAAAAVAARLRDPDAEVRAAAARALGAIRDRSALDRLLDVARNDGFEPAHAAAHAAGALDPDAVLAEAEVEAGGEERRHLREVADLVAL